MQQNIWNIVLRAVIFVLALVLLLDFLAVFASAAGRNIGGYTGIVLCIVVLLYTLFQPRVHRKISSMWRNAGVSRAFLIVAGILAVAIVLTAITETVFMVRYSRKEAPSSDSPPVVIVLGCQVRNGHPSLLLSERIETAYEYLSAHPECSCIVSGGQGPDEAMSEAECMYQELTRMGIDSDRIYKEDRSTTTRENLLFSKEIMEREGLGGTAILVTNSWHEFRAHMIADSLDLPCGTEGASTALWLLPCNYLRELYAILYQIIL